MVKTAPFPFIAALLILLTAGGCSAINDSVSDLVNSPEETPQIAPDPDVSPPPAEIPQESVVDEPEPTPAPIPPGPTGFAVQLSSFTDRRNAERLETILQNDGRSVYMVEYDGTLSIEHEDSLMTAKEGLEKGIRFLQRIVLRQEKGDVSWA